MVRTFNEGGIGLKDIRVMAPVATILWTIRLWTSDQPIWASWLCKRNVKGSALSEITLCSSYSLVWSSIFRAKELTIWVGRGTSATIANIYETIRPHPDINPLIGKGNVDNKIIQYVNRPLEVTLEPIAHL